MLVIFFRMKSIGQGRHSYLLDHLEKCDRTFNRENLMAVLASLKNTFKQASPVTKESHQELGTPQAL